MCGIGCSRAGCAVASSGSNERGNALSDRITGVPSLEERMDDLPAVMDAVGSECVKR